MRDSLNRLATAHIYISDRRSDGGFRGSLIGHRALGVRGRPGFEKNHHGWGGFRGEPIRVDDRVADPAGAGFRVPILQSNCLPPEGGRRQMRPTSDKLRVRGFNGGAQFVAESQNLRRPRSIGKAGKSRNGEGRSHAQQSNYHNNFDQRKSKVFRSRMGSARINRHPRSIGRDRAP
jgi:hypothetical protein